MRDDLIARLTKLRDAIAEGQAIASREDVRDACHTLSLAAAALTAQGETAPAPEHPRGLAEHQRGVRLNGGNPVPLAASSIPAAEGLDRKAQDTAERLGPAGGLDDFLPRGGSNKGAVRIILTALRAVAEGHR